MTRLRNFTFELWNSVYQSCAEFLLSFEILLVSHTALQHVSEIAHLRIY